jgi:arsenate reductase
MAQAPAPGTPAVRGAAYWFTASTSFANPAIDIGRMFSDSFAGIAPSSVPVFIAAQVGGGIAGVAIIKILYPELTPAQAAGAVVPHESADGEPAGLARAGRDGGRPARTGRD